MITKKQLQATAMFMMSTTKFLLVASCYFMVCYHSANYLLDIYVTDISMKASFPSAGFLVISVHLFWLVLFMIPSYSFQRFQESPNW